MSEIDSQNFGKGLDIGTSFVRFAERQGQEVVFCAERNAFIALTRGHQR
jgi:hypothetical protein